MSNIPKQSADENTVEYQDNTYVFVKGGKCINCAFYRKFSGYCEIRCGENRKRRDGKNGNFILLDTLPPLPISKPNILRVQDTLFRISSITIVKTNGFNQLFIYINDKVMDFQFNTKEETLAELSRIQEILNY